MWIGHDMLSCGRERVVQNRGNGNIQIRCAAKIRRTSKHRTPAPGNRFPDRCGFARPANCLRHRRDASQRGERGQRVQRQIQLCHRASRSGNSGSSPQNWAGAAQDRASAGTFVAGPRPRPRASRKFPHRCASSDPSDRTVFHQDAFHVCASADFRAGLPWQPRPWRMSARPFRRAETPNCPLDSGPTRRAEATAP